MHGRGRGGCCGSNHPRCLQGKTEQLMQPRLLLLIYQQPSYGYELMERLNSFRLQENPSDPGLVYRNLRRLEEDGFVRSQWHTGESGPAKRYYEITTEGKELLQTWMEHVARRRDALDEILHMYRGLTQVDSSAGPGHKSGKE